MEKLSKERQKWIRSLQLKKNRDEESVFVVEGEKSVLEGLQIFKQNLIELVSTENFIDLIPNTFHSILKIVSEKELEGISDLRTPNKFLAVFKKEIRTRFYRNY
jgi:TrmH family RNA methyltransferase